MKRLTIYFVLSVFVSHLFAQETGPSNMSIKRTEKEIQTIIDEFDAAGVAIAVIKDQDMIYSNTFGYRNLQTKEPLELNDIFRIASISKSFSSTAIMQLVEQGKLSLDDDFSDLVGFKVRNPKFPNTKITLEMVLSHRSSLNDSNGYFTFDVLDTTKNKNWKASYNDYEPGKGYEYCNLNFNMIGAVLERVTGQRFDNYIKKQILTPLHLDAGYTIDSLDQSRIAKLYEKDQGVFKESKS